MRRPGRRSRRVLAAWASSVDAVFSAGHGRSGLCKHYPRTYRARIAIPLAVGTKGTIDRPMKWAGGRAWVDSAGAPAVTHWTVVATHPDGTTELEVELETGRMHQIRVHLAAALGPILGDTKYGGPPAPALALRAVRLELVHPKTRAAMVFAVDAACAVP